MNSLKNKEGYMECSIGINIYKMYNIEYQSIENIAKKTQEK